MDRNSIIGNLEKMRRTSGLSQEELADKIGVARNTYGNLISGRTKVICEHLQPLADFYGIGLDELLLGYKPVDPAEAMLHDNNGFEEQRLAMVKSYEDLLSAANDKIREKDEKIADLRDHIKALQEIISMQKRHLGE